MKIILTTNKGVSTIIDTPNYAKIEFSRSKEEDIVVYSEDSDTNIKHSMDTDNDFNVIIEINR